MIKLISHKEVVEGGVYVQFCPMANSGQGAYWLSGEEKTVNPY